MIGSPRQLPVLRQFSLVKLRPFEHVSQRSNGKATANQTRLHLDRNLVSAYTAWKWGRPCSWYYILIAMPRKREISGMGHMMPPDQSGIVIITLP